MSIANKIDAKRHVYNGNKWNTATNSSQFNAGLDTAINIVSDVEIDRIMRILALRQNVFPDNGYNTHGRACAAAYNSAVADILAILRE